MTGVYIVWAVFIFGALFLRWRKRIVREIVLFARHAGEVGWGYHRASYWPDESAGG